MASKDTSYGECRATDEGQVDDKTFTKEELAIADDVTNLILQDFDRLPGKNDILLLLQATARQVFYQQSRMVSIKESTNEEEGMIDDRLDNDSDDVLLCVCGAQLHRMISVRKEQLKKRGRRGRTPISYFKVTTQKELISSHKYQWMTLKGSCSQCH